MRDPLGLGGFAAAMPQQSQKKKKDFFTDQISTVGGIIGGVAGAPLGLLGVGGGSAVGSGLGEALENILMGEDAFNNVAQEAAIGGIFGAGPLRLGKAALDVGKGLRAGGGLADALTNAGQKATTGSIRGAIGNKLTNASDDLVVKNFRLQPSQLSNFKGKFGEDASQVIKKYNLVGKDADTITEKTIKPLQDQFDSITVKLPALETVDVLKAFKAKYQPLLNSPVQDNRAIGQQLQQQADAIAKKYGAQIPGSEVGALRKEFDSLVSYADKTANPARYGVNKRSADALRSVLQQAADKAGIKSAEGLTYKEVGRELSKLRQLTENIAKQEQLGRGASPLGLATLLGGIGGGNVGDIGGGVGGALAGALLTKATNSGAGRRLAANAVDKAGANLKEKGAAANPYGLKSITARLAPVGAITSLGHLSSNQPNSAMPPMSSPTSAPNISPAIMDTSYNNPEQNASIDSINPYPVENLQADIQRDPANADQYMQTFELMQKAYAQPKAPKLSTTQQATAVRAANAMNDLSVLAQAIESGDIQKTLIPGSQSGIGGNLLGTSDIEAALFNIGDVVLRSRTGAQAPEAEIRKFVSGFLPRAGESREAQMSKLQRAYRELSGMVNPPAALDEGGSLEQALLSAQGAY